MAVRCDPRGIRRRDATFGRPSRRRECHDCHDDAVCRMDLQRGNARHIPRDCSHLDGRRMRRAEVLDALSHFRKNDDGSGIVDGEDGGLFAIEDEGEVEDDRTRIARRYWTRRLIFAKMMMDPR